MEEKDTQQTAALGTAALGEIHCVTIIGQVEGHQLMDADVKPTK